MSETSPPEYLPQVTVGVLGLDKQAHRAASLLLKDLIISRRNSLFSHVVRLGDDTSAHQAVRHQIDISLGRLPDPSWKRPSVRPGGKWLDQIRLVNNLPCTG